MASNGKYGKLQCTLTTDDKGESEVQFNGETHNAAPPEDNGWTAEFSGVADADGNNVKGSYREIDQQGNVTYAAATDGTGFTSPTDLTGRPYAQTAKDVLAGPAKACRQRALPWIPSG